MGIWVGRYAISHGEVVEHGPWLVERRRAQDEQPMRLLVLAEPVDERSEEFCHEVADAIAALFRREALSVTGGLLRALRQAHANLAEWNRRSLREHRVAVAVTCLVIRDHEVTLAQVGPCTAFVRSGNVLRRLSPAGAAAQPLGGGDAIEPSFERVVLPADEVLLLTANVEGAIGYDAIAGALAVGPERALAELFLRTRELANMTAVLVADLPQVGDDDGPAAPDFDDDEISDEPVPVARVESAPLPRPLPARSTVPRVRSTGGGSLLPATRPQIVRVAVGLTVALALLTLAWFTLPGLVRSDRLGRFDEIAATIGTQLEAATQASDPSVARAALVEAQSQLSAARVAAPTGDARLPQLEQRVADVATLLDRVTEVTDLRRVLETRGTLQTPLQVASLVGGESLWLVDHSRGRVLAVDPTGSAPAREVFRSGERYDGTVARDPAAASWDEVGRRLLLIDSERVLWSIADAGPPTRLALRGATDLRSITALAAYAGNIYILDGRGGEVWRYLPAGAGFDSERTAVLGGASFTDPRALLVDGDVFVLDGSALRHFRQGQEVESLFRGIDRAPQAPASLVEDGARGRLYTAEAGSRRIVISDRAGSFGGQLRNQAFLDLKAIALSRDGGMMYVLTGDGLYAFNPLAAR